MGFSGRESPNPRIWGREAKTSVNNGVERGGDYPCWFLLEFFGNLGLFLDFH